MIEDTILYNGEITLRFDSGRHTYRVIRKGKEYKVPSVTTVCGIVNKPALIPWAVNCAIDLCKGALSPGVEYAESYLEAVFKAAKQSSADIRKDAATRGRTIHTAIEMAIKGDESLSGVIECQILDWLKSFTIVGSEQRVYSRRYRYSGTYDALGRNEQGELVLIDFKTSRHLYPEFRLQTAAYVLAWEEEHPDQLIQGRYIVRIAEDGSIEPHFYPRATLRKDISAFLGAKRLFDQVQAIEKETLKAKKESLKFQ